MKQQNLLSLTQEQMDKGFRKIKREASEWNNGLEERKIEYNQGLVMHLFEVRGAERHWRYRDVWVGEEMIRQQFCESVIKVSSVSSEVPINKINFRGAVQVGIEDQINVTLFPATRAYRKGNMGLFVCDDFDNGVWVRRAYRTEEHAERIIITSPNGGVDIDDYFEDFIFRYEEGIAKREAGLIVGG